MKKLRLWIRDLSLSQQLVMIIFMVATIFTVFFMAFLNQSIDAMVNQQIFGILTRSQDAVAVLINEVDDYNFNVDTDSVHHFIYNPQVDSYDKLFGDYQLDENLLNDFTTKINSGELIKNLQVGNVDNHVYKAILLDDGRYLVSYMNDEYRASFRHAMYDGILNLNIIVVVSLFAFLMIWSVFIIKPLNQIKSYVAKLSKGEEATLNIDRRDEIGEVAMAIQQMHAELIKQERIKEEMVQNISHDLKTPIATIKSYGESIKDGIYPYDTLEKSVDVIIEHANRLEKKVYSLIVLNRMGYLEDVAPEGNSLNMVEVINKAILSMQVVKEDRNITAILNPVNFHGEEEPWRIVVENLLENALRYAKSEIVITLNENELEISNDGPLLSLDMQERMFKPYEKGTGGNFGLGLSIVYRICSTYGYNVSAENLTDGVIFRVSKNKVRRKNQLLGNK